MARPSPKRRSSCEKNDDTKELKPGLDQCPEPGCGSARVRSVRTAAGSARIGKNDDTGDRLAGTCVRSGAGAGLSGAGQRCTRGGQRQRIAQAGGNGCFVARGYSELGAAAVFCPSPIGPRPPRSRRKEIINVDQPCLSRRQLLCHAGCGFGLLALADLLAAADRASDPYAVRPPHFAPRPNG